MATAPTKLGGLKIKPDETGPEILAAAIVEISQSAKKLLGSRLQSRAIYILIKDALPQVGLRDIALVLEVASELEERYIKKPSSKTAK